MRLKGTLGAGLALTALALAGCGGGAVDADADGDGSISSEEMREAVAEAGGDMKPEPGKYSTTMEMIEIDMPGAPDAVKNMMGSMMNQTTEYCLTPEMAEKGWEESIKDGQNGECDVTTFTLDDGEVDMKMACEVEGGAGAMAIEMSGDVTSTTSDLTMSMNGSVPQMGEVSMKMGFKQKRIGDCD